MRSVGAKRYFSSSLTHICHETNYTSKRIGLLFSRPGSSKFSSVFVLKFDANSYPLGGALALPPADNISLCGQATTGSKFS